MMKAIVFLSAAFLPFAANAGLSMGGFGTLGNLSKAGDSPELALDWQARAEYFGILSGTKVGAVAAFNQVSERYSNYIQDLFLFADLGFGRVELGHTNGAAQKLAVGLVDAGGLRLNRSMLAFGTLDNPNVIATHSASSLQNQIRLSFVTRPGKWLQAGAGYAAPGDDTDGGFDLGLKLRAGTDIKASASLGGAYIINPDGLLAEIYAPRIYADSRAEMAAGINIGFGSWTAAATAKIVYDDNSIGAPSDGLMYGGGLSYEFLSWKLSINGTLSDTKFFKDGGEQVGVIMGSLQDKLDDVVDLWATFGTFRGDRSGTFWSLSLRAKF